MSTTDYEHLKQEFAKVMSFRAPCDATVEMLVRTAEAERDRESFPNFIEYQKDPKYQAYLKFMAEAQKKAK